MQLIVQSHVLLNSVVEFKSFRTEVCSGLTMHLSFDFG